MEIAVGLLSLWAGSWKSVSVCGVNAGFVSRPSAGARGPSIAAYVAGLLAGASTLTLVLAVAGAVANAFLRAPIEPRVSVVGASCLLLGTGELIRGAWLLPHIGWAVPRRWAVTLPPTLFLLAFGLIRGIALFNHLPFASFHAWILAVFLLQDTLSLVPLGVLLAIGLALWTLVYGAAWLGRRDGQWVFDTLAARSLVATRQLGRIDGVALVAIGTVIFALQRST